MGPTDFFETSARARGYRQIAGLDEAGRGPLAGPVVAAVVILPRRWSVQLLDDSKNLTERQRHSLFSSIINNAVDWGFGTASEQEIDRLNILAATRLAGMRAIQGLSRSPDFLLLDALHLPSVSIPQQPVVKGDQLSFSIAAASILAKVTRDRIMEEYHQKFPLYQFHIHKGYPTKDHLRRLRRFGPCSGHRQSFGPVQAILSS